MRHGRLVFQGARNEEEQGKTKAQCMKPGCNGDSILARCLSIQNRVVVTFTLFYILSVC